MASQRTNITSPVGRIVEGSLYKPNTTDFDGNPLKVKSGANAGQPRVDYFFSLAIPKGVETHWAHTPWGAIIWAEGHKAFPQAAQRPDFAWKIIDGDSTVPNKKNTRPCDKEGYPGHWVIRFSGGFAPKVYRQDGTGYVQVTEENYIKPGYFAEIAGTVDGNGNQNNPGLYLNHSMVCFRGYGPEINFGPNVNDAGFGQSPLPAGATLTPPPSAVPMPAAAVTQPSAPVAAPVPTAAALPPIPVTPNPQFLQVQAAVPNPSPSPVHAVAAAVAAPIPTSPAPVPAPPSSGPKMTALAGGASYESFIAGGWTEANMIAQGYMTL